MFKKCLLLLIFFSFFSCSGLSDKRLPQFYETKEQDVAFKREELIKENSGLVIHYKDFLCFYKTFEERFENFDCTSYGQGEAIVAFKLKKNRYFFDIGLFCKSAFISGLSASGLTLGRFLPTFKGIPSIGYFDVEAGDVIALDALNTDKDTKEFKILDFFEKKKNLAEKNLPNIAKLITKKQIKIAPTPNECKFLIEEEFFSKRQEEQIKIKQDPRYKECLKKLNELP